MSEEHPDDIVRLATAPHAVQAHIWRQALEAAGIRCQVVGDYLDAGLGDLPGLLLEIWVRRKDVPRAEAVLQQGPALSGEEPNASGEPEE